MNGAGALADKEASSAHGPEGRIVKGRPRLSVLFSRGATVATFLIALATLVVVTFWSTWQSGERPIDAARGRTQGSRPPTRPARDDDDQLGRHAPSRRGERARACPVGPRQAQLHGGAPDRA